MRKTTFFASLTMLVLTGCSTATEGPIPGFPGAIPQMTWSTDGFWAARLDGDSQVLFITTTGSSTCPTVIDTVDQDAAPDHLLVGMRQHSPKNGVCTMDLQPRTSFIRLAHPIDPAAEVTIELSNTGETITVTPAVGAARPPGVEMTGDSPEE